MKGKFKKMFQSGKDTYVPDIIKTANAYFHQNNFDEALGYYQLYAFINTHDPDAWTNLGNNYLMMNNIDMAFACYKIVVTLDFRHYGAILNIGNIFMTKFKNANEAEKWYKWGLSLKPQNSECATGLGGIEKQRGNFTKAKQYYSKSIKINPTNVPVLFQLGMIQTMNQQYSNAKKIFKNILVLQPDHQMAKVILQRIQEQQL